MAAKGLFYSVGEAASKLGKTASEVEDMVRRGELSEFRNENNELQIRREQVDLLVGDDDGIGLTDSVAGASGFGLADTGVCMATHSGITVFDMDDAEDADPSAQTQVTSTGGGLNLDSFGSGSGLLDLTRESDETSLGAEGLLDELYSTGEQAAPMGAGDGGPLFEGAASAGEASGFGAGAGAGLGMVMAAEAYDGKGSGLTGGLMLGATLCLMAGVASVVMAMMGAMPKQLLDVNMMIVFGAMAGVTLVFGVLGFLFSKK